MRPSLPFRVFPAVLAALLGGLPARALPRVEVLPAIQFVREGKSAVLKARAKGERPPRGWIWEVREPGQGTFESLSPGRVRFTPGPSRPWTTLQVRAASLDAPGAKGEATLVVLPHEVFSVLEEVLGEDWLLEHAAGPDPVRLEVVPPGFLSCSCHYEIHAEMDSWEADRFQWEVAEGTGEILRIKNDRSGRETAVLLPRRERFRRKTGRVRVRNLENPRRTGEIPFDIPPEPVGWWDYRWLPLTPPGLPGGLR
jgi:hypothetical protein